MADLAHARAATPAVHSLTMGDVTHAVINELVRGTPMRPDQVDPDETVINLSTTAFDLTMTFGRVARRLGLIGGGSDGG